MFFLHYLKTPDTQRIQCSLLHEVSSLFYHHINTLISFPVDFQHFHRHEGIHNGLDFAN